MDFKPRLGSCSLISHPILEYPEIGYSSDYTRFFSDAHVRPRWQQETTGPSVSGVALHRKLTVMQLHCPFLVRWFRAAFVLAVLHLLSRGAFAADLRLSVQGGYRDLVIEGVIETGDYERFLKVAKENQGQLVGVFIFSPGGNFKEAMKIGRALRELEMFSQVPTQSASGRAICDKDFRVPKDPTNCIAASAAFFVHIGSVHRGGTYLAVHRPYFERDLFANLSDSQAKAAFDGLQREARSYMDEMGVPPQVQEELMATPSDKILLLDERTVKTYFWGEPPYRQEWTKAKCSQLSQRQDQRFDALRVKLLSPSRLTPDEYSEYRSLEAKSDLERACVVALTEKSRVAAYEKFFGNVPDDTGNYNFNKWIEVIKYLGRTFEDVSGEERFDVDSTFMGLTTIKRAATASAPMVVLKDAPNQKKYVSWIGVLGPQNPSVEFMRRLRASLDSAWGKPKSTDGIDLWEWNGREFSAVLKLDHISATRADLTLVVNANRKYP